LTMQGANERIGFIEPPVQKTPVAQNQY
jgi:hypothetical protein